MASGAPVNRARPSLRASHEQEVGMNQGRVTIISLSISLLVSTAVMFAANRPTPKAQDSKRCCPITMNMQTKLNEFGMNGWELVSCRWAILTEPRLIFKR